MSIINNEEIQPLGMFANMPSGTTTASRAARINPTASQGARSSIKGPKA